MSHAPKYRKESVFSTSFRPLDRNAVARLLAYAEALDRRTHTPGKHGGCIGRTGLAVLKALVCRFFNKASGRLDPSLAAIAEAANVAKSTVQEAIKRLEAAGLLERVRRIGRVRVKVFSPLFNRTLDAERVLQISNAYRLCPAPRDHAESRSLRPTTPRFASDTGSLSGTNDIYNSMPDMLAGFTSDSLKASLMRLNEAITKRTATA